ncbi:MAG: class I SAM-dependent DNA methyltransferase [Alphaproteobacteria bacterium]|nr:class I SAM-dependent DNA methyltransferase [Alphaproteobacteria bacterium]
MNLNLLPPRKSLNKAYLKVKPSRNEIELFKKNLNELIDGLDESESEEHVKNDLSGFLKNTFYQKFYINTKGRNDLVIHNGPDAKTFAGVLIEAKKPSNKPEMVRRDNLNAKAFHELILYYLRERIINHNLEIKHLVATNIYEWYVFDVNLFEKSFAQNKNLVKQFIDFEEGRLAGKTTDFFYNEIAEPFMAAFTSEIYFSWFDFRDYDKPLRNDDKVDDAKLIALYKVLSPEHLLKLPFSNDSNTLDKSFYTELLHIIGLTETKSGSKKLIERKKEGSRDPGSLIENTILQIESRDKISRLPKPSQFGESHEQRLFNVSLELVITWLNRILFLKLLEAQLIRYHKGDPDYGFLNCDRIDGYDDLDNLFFRVLARKIDERDQEMAKLFSKVPYLNSSLFEPTELEQLTIFISNLQGHSQLPIIHSTVLKDNTGKKRTGKLSGLQYLFEFLDSYDFAGEGSEEIQEDNKTLINASVLGLIFEKLNGYKDGSFFTPGFITMYMCHETIRRSVIQKFNAAKGWSCKDLNGLYNIIEDKNESNTIINSLKICDPAVGSGHFLVSALNEIIAIKCELKILMDRQGKTLRDYHVEVVNDELIITDEDGGLFEYNPANKESQRIQEALFHEKQTIIENCLFGVDINPNSVKICRLRLWIELLKSAYYKQESNFSELETLPNIDINIKCGNSLISRYSLDADIKQALKRSKWSIDSYRLAVMSYRNATNKEEKRTMERLIESIKTDFETEVAANDKRLIQLRKLNGELFNLTQQTSLFDQSKKEKDEWNKKVIDLTTKIRKLETELEEIKNNRIYENAFEWRFEFPEVLNDEGDFVGFDVVIGNPPWGAIIEGKYLQYIKSENADIIVRMIDSFMFFINKSLVLKSIDGYVSMIVPDVLLYQIDNTKLRVKLLSGFQLIEVINLGDNIFQDVARAAAIVIVGSIKEKTSIVGLYRKKKDVSISNITFKTVPTHFFTKLPFHVFATENIEQYEILAKLGISTLGNHIDEDGIQRGVSPDFKNAFIVNDQICNDFHLEPEKIKPTLTGGVDVKKYQIINRSKKIIYTSNKDKPELIPNIFAYIKRYEKDITCKEVKEGKHPFYSLHRERDEKIFIKPEKILGVITGDKIIASIDTCGTYPTDGLFLMAANNFSANRFLIGVLNSKFFTILYRLFSFEEGRALAQIKPSILKDIPLPIIAKEDQNAIIEKVIEIEKMKKVDPLAKIDSLESEIDRLVYQLYGLTEEEIKIVEGA